MSIFEEERPKKPVSHDVGSDLSSLSADELSLRISLLREEIVRLENERERKSASRSVAESLFADPTFGKPMAQR